MSSQDPRTRAPESWHRRVLEHRSALFAVLTTVAISVGGLVEIVPLFTLDQTGAQGEGAPLGITPYTPLEVAGRDIYVSEGCYNCHSQMIRPFRAETLRYGEWSRSEEYRYDRPFQLGSRRIGPDLARVGGKYPDAWHYEHMRDPRATSPGSVMPPYAWLLEDRWDAADVQASVAALQALGHPYSDAEVAGVAAACDAQAAGIVQRLESAGLKASPDRKIIALIAYLQRLGVEGRKALDARSAALPAAAAAAGGEG
jgi:cytochrome c oxidase cbb3-type subunit I/II